MIGLRNVTRDFGDILAPKDFIGFHELFASSPVVLSLVTLASILLFRPPFKELFRGMNEQNISEFTELTFLKLLQIYTMLIRVYFFQLTMMVPSVDLIAAPITTTDMVITNNDASIIGKIRIFVLNF